MISIIICTHNRSGYLRRVLDSILDNAGDTGIPFELLVVDNNSKDTTRQVVENAAARYREVIRYVFEARQGLSHARNCGIRNAAGDWIVFTDDDVIVDAGWLSNIHTRIASDTDLQAYGGRIVPLWNCNSPSWFVKEGPYEMNGGHIVRLDLGESTAFFTPSGKSPVGANMGFRKTLFDSFGHFRKDLGKKGKRQIMGDDSEFCRRLWHHGIDIAYIHDAVVYHGVDKKRLTIPNMFSGYYHIGLSLGLQNRFPEGATRIAGVPAFLIKDIVENTMRSFLAILGRKAEISLFHAFTVSYAVGKVLGACKKLQSPTNG